MISGCECWTEIEDYADAKEEWLRSFLSLEWGSLVSIDAIGCQTEIAKKITEKNGYYLLAVKENQKGL